MDILNFISWIKAGEYRATLPTDTQNLIAIGAKDPSRDDGYRSLAINAEPLQAIYDTANVTQITSITTPVTVTAHNGIITTVSSTLASTLSTSFNVNNSKVTASSKIFVTVNYAGTGVPIVNISSIINGQFTIKITNGSAVALNDVLKISYLIIN